MQTRGFTLIEITIVLGLFAIIVGMAGIVSSVGNSQNQVRNVSTEAVDTLRRARAQTLSGKENDVWSVHFETSKFVLFKGVIYNASDPENIVTNLNDAVTISNISLTGGGSIVSFNDKFGNTATDGSITFSHSESSVTNVITVNTAGLIEVN